VPQKERFHSRELFSQKRYGEALREWRKQEELPHSLYDRRMLAEAAVGTGDPDARALISALGADRLGEQGLLAGRIDEAGVACQDLLKGLAVYREDPWQDPGVLVEGLDRAVALSRNDAACGRRVFEELRAPFAVGMQDTARRITLLRLAAAVDFPGMCTRALAEQRPPLPWVERDLRFRRDCLRATRAPEQAAAERDVSIFREREPIPLAQGLEPESHQADFASAPLPASTQSQNLSHAIEDPPPPPGVVDEGERDGGTGPHTPW
jgi:hypothetical protein